MTTLSSVYHFYCTATVSCSVTHFCSVTLRTHLVFLLHSAPCFQPTGMAVTLPAPVVVLLAFRSTEYSINGGNTHRTTETWWVFYNLSLIST